MKANLNNTVDTIPPKFDLRTTLKYGLPKTQQPYDQAEIGSCTAQACAFLYVFEQLKQNNKYPIMPSRLDIYYNSRYRSNDINNDSGSTINNALYSLQSGACIEKEWPYITTNYKIDAPPKAQTRKELFKALSMSSIDIDYNLPQNDIVIELKNTLLSGFPIVFGFDIYNSFESEWLTDGIMPMPQPGDFITESHCVVAIGYDDDKQSFLIRNSWGTEWGISTDRGYFYMPYSFIANEKYAYEFKILDGVTDPTTFKNEYDVSFLNQYNAKVIPENNTKIIPQYNYIALTTGTLSFCLFVSILYAYIILFIQINSML
jgi:C1A family cysteine protease